MIKLYSPRTEAETAVLKSILTAADIPFFVQNDFFGSLRVGPPIDHLNVKTFMVSEEVRDQAQDLILDYLEVTVPHPKPTSLRDRIRVTIEFLLFGWFIPGRISLADEHDPEGDDAKEVV